jgi:hypothetical protein
MTTINTRGAAHRISYAVVENGGGTESIVCGLPAPTTGYAVSLPGHEYTVHISVNIGGPDGPNKDAVRGIVKSDARAYAEAHKALLTVPGRYLGAWVDEGRVVFDITEVVPALSTAVRLGVEREQEAIYSFATGATIWLNTSANDASSEEQERAWEIMHQLRWAEHRAPIYRQDAVSSDGFSPFEVVGAAEYDADADTLNAVSDAESERFNVVERVIALWESENGWIPGAARVQLAEALGVPAERIRTAQQIQRSGSHIPFG